MHPYFLAFREDSQMSYPEFIVGSLLAKGRAGGHGAWLWFAREGVTTFALGTS